MKTKTVQAVLSGAIAAFSAYLNVMVVPLIILIVMMVADYISGMAASYLRCELSSKRGLRGIIKKLGYLLAVAVGMCADWLICTGLSQAGIRVESSLVLGCLVTVWLIVNEMISVLENLARAEIPLPDFLLHLIRRLKQSVEDKAP